GGATAIAAALARDPALAVAGDPQRLDGVLTVVLFVAATAVGASLPPGGARSVRDAFVVGAAAVAVGGLANGVDGRATVLFGNAEALGGYLAFAVPVAAAGDRWWSRAAGLGGAALLMATQTRGAWVGAAAGVAAVAWLRGRRRWVGVVAVV